MKVRSLVYILTLLIILGMAAFPVVPSEAETAQNDSVSSKKSTDSEKKSTDSEVEAELEGKVDEVLEKVNETLKGITELAEDENFNEENFDVDAFTEKVKGLFSNLDDIEGVEVIISEPSTKISKIFKDIEGYTEFEKKVQELAKDENLNSDEFAKKVMELAKNLNIKSSFILDKDDVKIFQIGPHVTTKTLKDTEGLKELMKMIEKLGEDRNLDEEQLANKIKNLIKNSKIGSTSDFAIGDVKVVTVGPTELSKIFKDPKVVKELEAEIKKLAEDENLDEEQLANKIKELLKGQKFDSTSIMDIGGVKVIKHGSRMSSNMSKDSKAIGELKQRIEKLEKKIDKLIEKLDKEHSESSETQ